MIEGMKTMRCQNSQRMNSSQNLFSLKTLKKKILSQLNLPKNEKKGSMRLKGLCVSKRKKVSVFNLNKKREKKRRQIFKKF